MGMWEEPKEVGEERIQEERKEGMLKEGGKEGRKERKGKETKKNETKRNEELLKETCASTSRMSNCLIVLYPSQLSVTSAMSPLLVLVGVEVHV
jgi:hypothetical protein